MLSVPRTDPGSNREDLMATITTAVGNGVAQEGSVAGRGIRIGTAVRPAW